MKWALKHGRTYFAQWTAIGPQFGATKKATPKFKTKRDAERFICTFPTLAMIGADAVKV